MNKCLFVLTLILLSLSLTSYTIKEAPKFTLSELTMYTESGIDTVTDLLTTKKFKYISKEDGILGICPEYTFAYGYVKSILPTAQIWFYKKEGKCNGIRVNTTARKVFATVESSLSKYKTDRYYDSSGYVDYYSYMNFSIEMYHNDVDNKYQLSMWETK